jgi:hypothetical protein
MDVAEVDFHHHIIFLRDGGSIRRSSRIIIKFHIFLFSSYYLFFVMIIMICLPSLLVALGLWIHKPDAETSLIGTKTVDF